MNFGDFTESLLPLPTDYLAGYATGGGAGSDRRSQIQNIFKKSTLLAIGSAAGANSGIELGDVSGFAGQSFIDFHAGATPVDYDARLLATGGTGATGGGQLLVSSATFAPLTNDAVPLGIGGGSPLGWSDLFLASGANINFANGNYLITHSSGLLQFETTVTAAAMARLQNDDPGALGVVLDFMHNSASPANNDIISRLSFSAKSSTAVTRQFAGIDVTGTNFNNTTEAGIIDFAVMVAGTLTPKVRVDLNGLGILPATAVTAGGNLAMSLRFSTTQLGVFCGSGAPTINAAAGSIYLRTDGSSTVTRGYISQGGGTWTAITTVA